MSCYNKQFSIIQFRRGLEADFVSSNIVLASGEPAYAVDTATFKIGDGVTPWNSLAGIIPSGSLSQFSSISSSGLASLITDETGSGLSVFNDSPLFTGIPLAPTATSGTNTNQIASTEFVINELNNLIDSAPNTLNTLNELAAALNDDSNFASTITNSLAGKANLSGGTFTGTISGPSGDFVVLKQNGIVVSVSGHTHSTNDITDFNNAISGLLPVTNILAGSNIGVISSGSIFTVSVTGQLGLTTEEVDDRISNLLIAGSYVNLNYDDNNNNLTVSVTGVQPSGNYANSVHTHISSDITDFNSSVSGLLPTVSGTGYIVSSFSNNTYTISATGLQPSGNYSLAGHSHSSSDITDFNSSVSGLIPVKDIVAGANMGVSSVSGVYTISTDNESSALVTTVFNKTGSPISKMSAVYIDGGQGDQPTVALAVATGDPTSAGTYGLTFETIPNMSTGKVVVFGGLTGLNTDQFNPTAPHGDVNGQVLYLSPTTPGGLTLTKPIAPNHMVAVGTIVRTHQNQGVIEVRVQNGFELDELHNVAISGVTNGQFLQYNGSGLWVPSSSGNFSTLLVNGTGVSLNGHTHTSSNITDFSSSVSGLLPVTNILGGSNVSVSSSGSIYTVAVTGSLGLTTEEVDDRVSNLLIAGSGISINYNDNANSLTISTIKNIILSDTVGSTNYIGKAIQGSSTGSNVWTIKRTIYTSGGSVSSTGTAANVAWDNRLTESYS